MKNKVDSKPKNFTAVSNYKKSTFVESRSGYSKNTLGKYRTEHSIRSNHKRRHSWVGQWVDFLSFMSQKVKNFSL